MGTQELREKLVFILERYSFDQDGWNVLPTSQFGDVIDQIQAVYKEVYSIMYQDGAEFVGWLLDKGWIPPEEAEMYVKLADDLEFRISTRVAQAWRQGKEGLGKDYVVKLNTGEIMTLIKRKVEIKK